jgi:hypothetical protein
VIKSLLGLAIFTTTSAYALNWEDNYGATIAAGYDDNLRLASANELETSFGSLALFARVDGRSAVTDVQLRVGINNDNYSDSEVDGRTTGNLSLSVNKQQSELLQTGVNLSYLIEPTLQTELSDSGILVDSTRDTVNVSPTLGYSLSERSSISVNLSFTDVSYGTDSFEEYQDNSISLGWSYNLDETSILSINLSRSQFDPVDAVTTNSNSLYLGYNMRQTETLSYNFSAGFTDVDSAANSQTSNNYGVAISHTPDKFNDVTFDASRSLQASGTGVVREQDHLGLNWMHAFTEKVAGILTIDYIDSDDREYYSIQPDVNYRLSKNATISGNYRFSKQDISSGDAAESNSLLFTLSYNH